MTVFAQPPSAAGLRIRRFYESVRLFPGLDADQITIVVNIPYGDWMRGAVDVRPAVVGERLGHLVDMPLPGVLVVAHHLPTVQHAGPDFAVRVGLRFVEVRVRARSDRRNVLLDKPRLGIQLDQGAIAAAEPRDCRRDRTRRAWPVIMCTPEFCLIHSPVLRSMRSMVFPHAGSPPPP